MIIKLTLKVEGAGEGKHVAQEAAINVANSHRVRDAIRTAVENVVGSHYPENKQDREYVRVSVIDVECVPE